MHQMTLRQIPSNLELRIRKLASRNKESINKTVLKMLMKSVGIDNSNKKKRDLSAIAGTWTQKDEEEFNEAVKIFDTVDEEIWKQ